MESKKILSHLSEPDVLREARGVVREMAGDPDVIRSAGRVQYLCLDGQVAQLQIVLTKKKEEFIPEPTDETDAVNLKMRATNG